MGIKKTANLEEYWPSDEMIRDTFTTSVMSRNRFEWFLRHLHVNDNSAQPPRNDQNYDKLYKIRPLLEMLSKTFKDCYMPSTVQSIDESTIRCKGRCSIHQYMPQIAIKRGYEVCVRANDSGFVSEFQIYTGKIGQTTEKI
jgi:hypothetical protein